MDKITIQVEIEIKEALHFENICKGCVLSVGRFLCANRFLCPSQIDGPKNLQIASKPIKVESK